MQASVYIVAPDARFGLISDIDDTVITTSLPRPMIAAWNTFFRHENARRVVPGMGPLYRTIMAEHPGAPIIFVSTGAWNTAPTLTPLPQAQRFPHRAAAAHRLGADEHGLVPKRSGPQAGVPGPTGQGLPQDQVAAHR